jgi:CO/xanthine dehydrogenase FAD-binding subunit
MKGNRMHKFEYFTPKTLEEVLSLLSQYKRRAKIIAGGTDLLVRMKEGKIMPEYLISLGSVNGLDHIIQDSSGSFCIGALTTHQSIVDSYLFQGVHQLLATACHKIGTPQIRNMGTIGGNLCNASPSVDSAPPLLVMEAKLKLANAMGKREVPLDEFFIGPFQTVMQEDEILTEIIIPPLPSRTAGSYQYLTKVTAVDETLLGVAALVTMDREVLDDVRLALCSVAPTPIRARQAEGVLKGRKADIDVIEKAAALVANEINPRSRADYRRRMSTLLAKRAINEAIIRVANYGG